MAWELVSKVGKNLEFHMSLFDILRLFRLLQQEENFSLWEKNTSNREEKNRTTDFFNIFIKHFIWAEKIAVFTQKQQVLRGRVAEHVLKILRGTARHTQSKILWKNSVCRILV